MSSQFYTERRKDKQAERQADREDRAAERAELRKDADAERRRKAAERKERDERRTRARRERAAKVRKLTGWVAGDPARAFVRLVQACSIVPAVISQVGALTGSGVEPLLAGLLAAMLEGSAWALVAMGSRAEGERSTRTYRLGAWTAGIVAGAINYAHGRDQYPAHSWVAAVLALSSLVAVWLTDLQTHGGRGPTKAEKKAAREREAHTKARVKHHPEVLKVADRLISATPFGSLHPDDAWKIAWHYVKGVEVPGVTAELIAGQLRAQARVAEVSAPRREVPDWGPEMPPDPFLDDLDSVYRAAFPEALEAASWGSFDDAPPLGGIGLQTPHGGPHEAPAAARKRAVGNAPQTAGERPLDPEHLTQVRQLADLLESSGQALTAPQIRKLIGCRNEYAVRLRNQVQAERRGEDDGGLPVGAH